MGETTALEPGTVIAGRYRVASKIGHGGMGAVYHVNHVHTDESLALKLLHAQVLRDPSVVERFRREARAPAKITSEHIARVTDADTAPELDGAPFYVMELLRGRDLERVLLDDGPLPPDKVVEYLRQMARALDKAHVLGIIHRDLKPENLFLTHREDGSPCIKLLDFGIARLADVDGPAMMTQVGYVFGTPNYMAPEQTTGSAEQIGPATDVWAIGLVAFKLLVGQEYFTGKTAAHLYAQILAEPLPAPTERGSSHGPQFDAWFGRCVTRKPEDRFSSAGDAIAGLASALGVALAERYSSANLLPTASRVPSDPALEAPPPGQTASVLTNPLTELPAGLPQPPSRRNLIAVVGGLIGLVVVVGASYGIYAVSSSSASHGLVAASGAAPSASASGVDRAPPPSVTALSPDLPAASAPSGAATVATGPVVPTNAQAHAPTPKPSATKDEHVTLSRDQKKRLEALERLCRQGTFTPTECQAKRQAISHGGP